MTRNIKTLNEILSQKITRGGAFGLDECKKAVEFQHDVFKKSYYQLLEEYYDEYKSNIFFNTNMINACWQIINEQ